MSTLQIGNISVAYDDVGTGQPVVFIHGHPFNRSMWRDQAEALAATYRVITPDLRGYGETTVMPGKTLLEDFARDLAGLLDALGIPRIVLGGLSMGGQIVFEFYRLFPERVGALLLADTSAPQDTDEGRRVRNQIAERLLREGMGGYADEVLSKMVSKKTLTEHPEIAARVLEMMRTTHPEGAAAAMRGRSERPDYTGMLPQISVPTLIIVGSVDEFTPISDADVMHQRIPNSQLVIVEGAGHMPNMECAAAVNEKLLEFLNTITP